MSRQFDDVQLGDIELFCMAADAASFTAAAEQAGVTPGAVSRSVGRLEARLGVRLFVRTTRQIRLTDAGQLYLGSCRQTLSQLLDAERQVSGQQVTPSGVLRISMPSTYGQHRVLPLLPGFRQRYPQIALEVQLSNRNVDFAEEPFDLAIRARAPADSRLVMRKIEEAALAVVASPVYLAQAGVPRTLDDLATHECVQFLLPSTGRRIEWSFRVDGQEVDVAVSGHITCSDELYGGVLLARHGGGLYQAYRFMVERELQSGELVEVLADFAGRSRPFSVVYPHGRHLPLRVRALVDHLVEGLSMPPTCINAERIHT
jgi:DNA-binding transcriptional LysR family regulator